MLLGQMVTVWWSRERALSHTVQLRQLCRLPETLQLCALVPPSEQWGKQEGFSPRAGVRRDQAVEPFQGPWPRVHTPKCSVSIIAISYLTRTGAARQEILSLLCFQTSCGHGGDPGHSGPSSGRCSARLPSLPRGRESLSTHTQTPPPTWLPTPHVALSSLKSVHPHLNPQCLFTLKGPLREPGYQSRVSRL